MPPLCSAPRSRQLGQGARPDGGPATAAGTRAARDEAAASAARAARSETEPWRC